MSDDFAICGHCGAENELVDIKLVHESLGEVPKDIVSSYLFCLICGKTQLKKETHWRHVEYGEGK